MLGIYVRFLLEEKSALAKKQSSETILLKGDRQGDLTNNKNILRSPHSPGQHLNGQNQHFLYSVLMLSQLTNPLCGKGNSQSINNLVL